MNNKHTSTLAHTNTKYGKRTARTIERLAAPETLPAAPSRRANASPDALCSMGRPIASPATLYSIGKTRSERVAPIVSATSPGLFRWAEPC